MSLTGQEKFETAPTDKRFPTTNQAKHCYMYYNSWHQCKYDHSDEEPQCQKLRQWSFSMCPVLWIEKWEEQRANGTYPGPVPGEARHAQSQKGGILVTSLATAHPGG